MNDLDAIAALIYGPQEPSAAVPVPDEASAKRQRLAAAVEALRPSIEAIKEGIATDNLSKAAEAWFELTNEERESIWIAPTRNEKGKRVPNEHAPFTTQERQVIASAEFRKAHFGEGS